MEMRTERPVSREDLQAMLHQEIHEEPSKGMLRTWKPITGGILSIISGYLNIIAGALLVVGFSSGALTLFASGFGAGMGVLLVALGIVSVIGGAFAVRRRSWWMALAGSITALLPTLSLIPGVLSLIFVSNGKAEFYK